MSAPETKALPPAPLTTITRTASSSSKSSMIWVTACHISSDTALWRAGLLKIRRPIGPSFSAIILLVASGWSSMLLAPYVSVCAVIASGAKQSRAGLPETSRLLRRLWLLAMTLRSYDRTGAQIGDRGLVVPELPQYLARVLAEIGGRAQLFRLGGAGHVDRLADGLQRAELWMVDRPCHFQMLDLRVSESLVDRVDRPARHTHLVHQLDPIGSGPLSSDLADPFVERLPVFRTRRAVRIIGIVEQCHCIGRLAEAAEHVVARGRNVDLPVRGREHTGGDAGRMVVARLLGDFARHQPARALEVEHKDLRFEQRGVHPLPFAAHLALDQRHQHTLGQQQPGAEIVDRDAEDRKSTRLNSSHLVISYAVFC